MGNGINKVLPDLYLGNFKDARDKELLAKHNITHILSIHDTAAPILELEDYRGSLYRRGSFFSPRRSHNVTVHFCPLRPWFTISCQEMKYLCIPAADASKQNLTQFFKDSIIFIHESRLKGKGCLVHCVAGVSRSVTLVVVYIMTVTGRGWVESLAAVRVVRPCAGPNVGFLRQLEDFENLELAQYREWFKDRYKENHFNDEEDIRALLWQKSQAISESIATATATAAQLATSNT